LNQIENLQLSNDVLPTQYCSTQNMVYYIGMDCNPGLPNTFLIPGWRHERPPNTGN